MARCFAKVSEEEIEEFGKYLKQLSPSGSVKSGGYIPRRFASRYIFTTIQFPFGDSCIILSRTTSAQRDYAKFTKRHCYFEV